MVTDLSLTLCRRGILILNYDGFFFYKILNYDVAYSFLREILSDVTVT
jgi:hypothetical protein